QAARDQTTQRTVTAYLISDARRREDREQHRADAWLAVVREAQVDRVAAAERLAWLAYDAGQFDLAAQWLELADEREPMTLWIASRLALRKGEIERGMQLLAAASNAFAPAVSGDHPAAVPSSTHAELGVVHLARGQYVDSLHQLLRTGYWEEAAYVA